MVALPALTHATMTMQTSAPTIGAPTMASDKGDKGAASVAMLLASSM